VPLHAVNVDLAIGHFASALAFKNHASQAFHRGVMSVVQRLFFVTEQFNRLTDAAGLVNAALFTDRQVHRQMQEGVVPGRIDVLHGCQSSIHIRQFGVVLRMFIDPLAGQNFNGLQGRA